MEEENNWKFEDQRYCRVSIDSPYIEKITKKLQIKKMMGDWCETEELLAKILLHVYNYNDLWIDKKGIQR